MGEMVKARWGPGMKNKQREIVSRKVLLRQRGSGEGSRSGGPQGPADKPAGIRRGLKSSRHSDSHRRLGQCLSGASWQEFIPALLYLPSAGDALGWMHCHTLHVNNFQAQ